MRLRSLTIERLAGLRSGLRLEPEHLTGRVRVLHGPNAIGKSSIVRALKALLWPNAAPTRGHVEIEGRFEIGGVEWIARRDGAITRWTRDGIAIDTQPLPPGVHANHLLVGLEDLGLGMETDVQGHVQRELGGGYDVASVEEGFRPSLQAGRAEANALRIADEVLRRARDSQAKVVQEWTTLEDLRRERDTALTARKQVANLEAARAFAEAREAKVRTKSTLDAFPRGMDLLRGTEANELDEIRARLTKGRVGVASARAEEARLAREIAALGLTEPVRPALLDELGERADEIRDADSALREAEKAVTRATSRVATATRVFGPNADVHRLATLDEGLDAEIEKFVRDSTALAERRAAVLARIEALGDGAEVEAPAPRAVAALEDWLATPRAARSDARARTVLLVLAVALLVLAVGLAFVHPAYLLIAILAVAAFLGAKTGTVVTGTTRVDHEASYAKTGEDSPVAWTEDGVRARLEEMRCRQARAKDGELRAELRRDLHAQRASLEAESLQVGERRANLAGQLGTTMSAPDGLLLGTMRARAELRDARDDLQACTAALAATTRARDGVLVKLNDALNALGRPSVADHAAAKACVASLVLTSASLVSLRKDHHAQIALAEGAESTARQCEGEIAAVFRRNRLEPTDETTLLQRLQQLAAWKVAQEAHGKDERDVELHARNVSVVLAASSVDQIEEQLVEARALAAPADELTRRVIEIETRLKDAQAGRVLENAQAERNACRSALRKELAKAQRGELARGLLADVRDAHDSSSRPRLVAVADALLARFTRGRYGLRAVKLEGRVEFRAYDSENAGQTLTLEQLSDGTRAQLLLAARLAYLREIEHGNPMPIVLDDALATSDPDRIRQIGAALLDVARDEDRQFLVLTKDGSDVALLRPLDAEPGEVLATDLAAVRRVNAPAVARELLRIPEAPRVPDSAGRTIEEYAAVLEAAGLPPRPIDPHAPVDEVHLWWVLQHDLALLERLLALRLDNVGKLQNAANLGVAFFGERERSTVEPWIELVANTLDAWRVGRGRPIDREVLERAGVSDTFVERMVNLAKSVGGDAKAWVAAVRDGHELAKRYHTKTLEQNREFLVREGYLDEREVLSREGAWMRVLAALPARPGIDDHALRARFEHVWKACGP